MVTAVEFTGDRVGRLRSQKSASCRGFLAAFFAAAVFCVTELRAQPENTVQLSGNNWRIREDATGKGVEEALFTADPAAWIPATVPGNIQADLEAARLLKPISYGAGDPALKEVAAKNWWYRKDFTIPAELQGKRLTLVFDGVDYECEVWLNGQKLGGNVGMFQRFWFDVTSAARPGVLNRLAVRIAKFPTWSAATYSNEFKSGTNLGWDWGVPVATLGIWKDVRLEATGPARIDWMRVQTTLGANQATVTASLEIDSATEMPAKTRFLISGHGQSSEVLVEAPLKQGANQIDAQLKLERPVLWWPAGHGEQPLYNITAEVLPAAGGEPSARRTCRFGVRDLRWVHTEGAPADFINRFQLVINGRLVRTIGSNLIPTDLYFGRMTERALFRLHQAKAAGMNTVRLWGGGVILHESVYDLADELGLMLVQEFPMFHYTPPTDAAYLARLENWSRNIVRQVRNHPSIIEFDGGNEMKWRSDTDHPAFLLLKRVVAEEDGRVFRAGCPDLGSTHGAWDFSLWPGKFDCRFYDDYKTRVQHQGQSLLLPTMRAGEYGSAAPAHLEVWHREIPLKEQWPIIGLESTTLKRKKVVRAIGPHNWLQKGMLENEFGPFESLAELIQVGDFRGAEGLRYATDAFRRMGKRIGGMTTWDLNEPWPNGAGSYLVDYDGRPRMMYEFLKQAITPIALSLKYNSVFYPLATGIKAELFLTSDAPQPAENLRWKWVARDRRGTVFAQNAGSASISPIESKSLGELKLMPPAKTVFGPVFMELRLEDAAGKLLSERLHIFGLANLPAPFAPLIKQGTDADDDPSLITTGADRPSDSNNLLYRLKATGMTPPPPSVPPQYRDVLAVNDGFFGNDYGWSDGWFQAELRGTPTIGRFRFGRDRTGVLSDRAADYIRIETSMDGTTWQTVFEQDKLTQLPGFSPAKTLEIQIQPVKARYLKVWVVRQGTEQGPYPVLDEFEVYAPAEKPASTLPQLAVLERPEFYRPLRRTTLEVKVSPVRLEGTKEVLELNLKNSGPMTAFPCQVHPLIGYRTDLFVENNYCFIPPGESRTITIRSAMSSPTGLTLAQTGWRISSCNAQEIEIAPSAKVLLAVGRRDQMCREFAGYFEPEKIAESKAAALSGTRPDPAQLSYLLDGGKKARFEFPANAAAAKQAARLRIHTADQSKEVGAVVSLKLNGKAMEQTLPAGLGIQKEDPAHLAYPETLEFAVPAGVLRERGNALEVRVASGGWFTWDSVEIVQTPK